MIIIGIIEAVEEAAVDSAAVEVTDKCMMQYVLIVEVIAKYLSDLLVLSLYCAVIALADLAEMKVIEVVEETIEVDRMVEMTDPHRDLCQTISHSLMS